MNGRPFITCEWYFHHVMQASQVINQQGTSHAPLAARPLPYLGPAALSARPLRAQACTLLVRILLALLLGTSTSLRGERQIRGAVNGLAGALKVVGPTGAAAKVCLERRGKLKRI